MRTPAFSQKIHRDEYVNTSSWAKEICCASLRSAQPTELVAPGSPKGIPKTYLDPFSGARGPLKSAAAHIPLQATLWEAGILGGANGIVEEAVNGACGCNK